MRPGLKATNRRVVDLPPVVGNGSALALTTTSGEPSSSLTRPPPQQQQQQLVALPPIPPAPRDPMDPLVAPVRTATGALVPALTLRAHTVGDDGGSTLVVKAQPPQRGSLTARKPTDSDLGNLERRLRIIDAAKISAAGPVSHWPVHGGAETARTAAASNARPPLALELEAFVRRETNMLLRQAPTSDGLAKASIAKEAFGCFIGHFPEYAVPLQLVKALYDEAVDQAHALRRQNHQLMTENIGFREYHNTMLEGERKHAKAAATEAHRKLAALEAFSQAQMTRQKEIEIELTRLTRTLTERNQQLDECEARATLFEKAVIELTDKSVGLHQKYAQSRREVERLVLNVATLEQQVREAENTAAESIMGASRRARSKSIAAVAQHALAHSRGQTMSPPIALAPNSPVERRVPKLAFSQSPEFISAFGGDHDAAMDAIDDDAADADADTVFSLEAKLKKLNRYVHSINAEKAALVQRIESLQANLDREKNDMTPRPPWTSASDVLPGFSVNQLATSEETLVDLVQYFKDELSEEKRENERKAMTTTIREWLGQEDLCEGDLVGKHRYFTCKGTGNHVPIYLRAKGVVRNRKLRKGDVEKLLSKFWSDRRVQIRIETHLNVTPLHEYFHSWLQTLTGTLKSAVELAYNVIAVCEQYQHDPDCAMFLRILRGELCEHAIFDQQDMLQNLQEIMVANDPRKKKSLSRFTIHRILNKFFPTKGRDDMLRLRFSLALSSKGLTMVDYEQLFLEDEEGNQSRFVELIRRQHVEEAAIFTVEVEEALREAVRPDGQIDLNNGRMALKHLDPSMPNSRIEEIVAFGCGMTVSELESHGQYFTVEAEPFLARLRRGVLLKRYSRRAPQHGEDDESSSEEEDDDDTNLDNDGQAEDDLDEFGQVREIVIPDAVKAARLPTSPFAPNAALLDGTEGAANRSTEEHRRSKQFAKKDELRFLNVFKRQQKTSERSSTSEGSTPLIQPGAPIDSKTAFDAVKQGLGMSRLSHSD